MNTIAYISQFSKHKAQKKKKPTVINGLAYDGDLLYPSHAKLRWLKLLLHLWSGKNFDLQP